ncbi:uncharacterized protein LOC131641523 [Vicia villosa]|uniref:uncharacterized protein LOC131641523 n=1 Tax=Vicia villosa TaxID=3911 RepID=UPI00273B39E9|nr:uncharacterized protein LOC131641523 [Vicia villosa]
MSKDCIEFAKGCQECQMHGGIQHVPASELHAIVKPWPFRGWALDVIGEIKPASSKQQRYILVGINYFTKWVEAVALRNVDQETVIDFIQDHIICRFGIPETITIDQGTVFTGKKMQEFAQEVGIKLLTSTPYYAQANGKKPKTWHQSFSQALWACRTSPKEATGTTPFRLTYGHDAVLPVKVYVQSVRIQKQHEIPSEDYWSMMIDELVGLDEERMLDLDSFRRRKEKVARAYNKKVRNKVFAINYLVWKVILPMDRNDRFQGKWSPNWEGPFKVIQVFTNNAYELEELAPNRRIIRVNGKYLKEHKPTLQELTISTT